uniref:Phenylalanine--tRNA ligase beta subunit n=1 Tax=Anthurium amnicola TaxID=1678845 RepID=A0A1D1YX28_9ARAE
MTQNGADFHLPDEILAVIPTDPYDQLDLARKITSMAIASRVSRLEGEAGRLQQKVADKDRVIAELQDRLVELNRMFQEADARLRTSLEENIKLSKERDSLVMMTKKLTRELAKLEAFKRHLMQSLSEDDSTHTETVDIGTCDQSISKISTWKGDGSVGHTASNRVTESTKIGNTYLEGSRNVGQKFSMTPYISPRFTPTATPKVASTGGSPGGLSAAGSPKMLSGATSPTKPRIEGQTALSPWYPSSQLSSAASSPPRGRSLPGRTPRIDGKEFFRQARNRLSYEQFGAFLANIKELNAHRQSREETLKKAEDIFGTDNKDLYLSFQGLLYRNMP